MEWDSLVGMSYYFRDGGVELSSKAIKSMKHDQKQTIMLNTLKKMAEDDCLGKRLFLIIDDASPEKIDDNLLRKALHPHPHVLVHWKTNRGVGAKSNAMMWVAIQIGSKVYVEVDADLELQSGLEHALKGLQLPSVGISTISAGFLSFYVFHGVNSDYAEVSSVSGGLRMIPVEVLEDVGLSDPELRYYEDMDWLSRARIRGYRSMMSRISKGVCQSSGAGCSVQKRQEMARYLFSRNPLIQVGKRRDGTPVIRLPDVDKGDGFDLDIQDPKMGPGEAALELWEEVKGQI